MVPELLASLVQMLPQKNQLLSAMRGTSRCGDSVNNSPMWSLNDQQPVNFSPERAEVVLATQIFHPLAINVQQLGRSRFLA